LLFLVQYLQQTIVSSPPWQKPALQKTILQKKPTYNPLAKL
jgi:hypothetical protein